MNILLSDARHIPHHRRKSAGKAKESIQLLSTPGHTPRSVLLFFCSSLSKSSCGQKKSAATVPSRASFPKASAKVRTFSLPAKFFRDFFQKKCIFALAERKTAKHGAERTPIYYCVRACGSERTGPHHGKGRKGRTNILFPEFSIFPGISGTEGFLCPEKGGKGEKDENVVLICLGCLQKTTHVLL